MSRLNIFVDETGDFGFNKKLSSHLYGISFTFHNQSSNISDELTTLNEKLNNIGYNDMIHMADLIMHRGDYKNFDIKVRKKIFNSIYQFSRRIEVKYHSIIIDKDFINNSRILKQKIAFEINKMVRNNYKYFSKFDKIVMYYDNGQEVLGTILDSIFLQFEHFEHRVYFSHKEKRLFQVSDMLTFLDKYDYKYKNKKNFTAGEKYFFTVYEMRKILKELKSKRL